MNISSRKGMATVLLTAGIFSVLGTASAATTTPIKTTIAGVPINTFCSTYAKDLATKSVAIGLILKIKDNPTLKESLMRQYATFVSLGKIYCKDQYAPSVYGFTHTSSSTTPATSNVIDTSNNTPIIISKTAYFSGPEDYFTGYDTTLLTTLNSQQLEIVQQRIAKAKIEYAEIVEDLINQGWLKTADKNEMVEKITFKFSDNCNQLDGKILVRQWFDQYNNPLKTELINLFITINLCFTHSYESNYETFLDRIIYHELGHYYNYFYDKNDEGFTSLCWSKGQNICQSTDFVSTYALSSSDEDYAETFSAYIQNMKFNQGTKILQKLDYFKIKDPRYK